MGIRTTLIVIVLAGAGARRWRDSSTEGAEPVTLLVPSVGLSRAHAHSSRELLISQVAVVFDSTQRFRNCS